MTFACLQLPFPGGELGLVQTTESSGSLHRLVRGPLRLAIAGKVKAGKSTLLNAILGDELAPSDAW